MADIQVANTDADLSGNTVVTEENAYTITGLHTFSRSTNAPFACISGAAYVQYLDSDKLDGQEGTYYLAAANFTGTLAVNQGGTGAATFTDGGILLGSGTGAITATAVLGDGVILIGDASGDPTTLDVGSSTAITILGTVATGVWNGTAVTVAYGGTGASSLTDGGVLLGSGTGAITAMSVLTDGQMIVGDGSGDPVAESGATLRTSIGVGTGDSPTFTAVTAGQVDITAEGDLRLQDNTGGEYVGLDAPSAVSGSYTLTFPAAIGAVDQVLSISNTDGTLQWATPETGDITSVVAGAGMTGGGASGDVTLNVIGTADKVTVSADAVTIASTYIGQTSITTLGTIGTGTWQGTAVAAAYGGTGQTSYTTGDLPYASGSTAISKLGIGTANKVLTSSGSAPQWSTQVVNAALPTNVDLGGTLDVTGATTLDSTLTVVDDLAVDTDTLFVDASADKVAIGTTAMDGLLHIQSASAGSVSAHANADELVLENSAHAGMTILAGNTSNANIFFGDAASSTQGQIYFTNNDTTASLNIQNEFGYVNLLPSGGGATGVGVGVNDPDVILDVSGGDNVLDIFRITQRASGAAAYGLQVGLADTGDPTFQRLVNDVATESFRMQRSSGLVAFSNGVSFNPAETTAANTLDDYEEGTFTPVLTGTTSASGVGYDTQAGIYTKVGNRVDFNVQISLNDEGTIVGYLKITGLPFTPGTSEYKMCATSCQQVILGDHYEAVCIVYSTSPFMYCFMQAQNAAGSQQQMNATTINDSSAFYITGSYTV